MKQIAVLVLPALVLVGISYALFQGSPAHEIPCTSLPYAGRPSSDASIAEADVNRKSILSSLLPDIDYIPVYTDVVEVANPHNVDKAGHNVDGLSGYRFLDYEAKASFSDLDKFYTEAFQGRGWEPLYPPTRDSYMQGVYIWTNPVTTSPWHLSLEFRLVNLELMDAKPNSTRVYLAYERFPDIGDGLPIYPNAAEQNTICTETMVDNRPLDKKKVEYIAPSSVEQVIEYYAKNMPDYGWQALDISTVKDRLSFRGKIRAGDSSPGFFVLWPNLDIIAQPIDSQNSKVQMELQIGRDTTTMIP